MWLRFRRILGILLFFQEAQLQRLNTATTAAFTNANVAGNAIIAWVEYPFGAADVTGCTDLNGDTFKNILVGGTGFGSGNLSVRSCSP